jgi:hypothetical protein
MSFKGTPMNLGSISKLSKAQTRCITAENVYGEKGKGAMAEVSDTPQSEVTRIGQSWGRNEFCEELGKGWKVRPAIGLQPGKVTTIMDIDGPAIIQHMWFTLREKQFRDVIVRIYWDNETNPSVECPIGDFFCNGFNKAVPVMALPINVNPQGGLNCYFPMPFRKHVKITMENRGPAETGLFYAITYTLTDVDDDEAYFHAQFRRTNPVPLHQECVVVDNIKGWGHYVGTYFAWQQHFGGWWGEGEVKFFMDGDRDHPTIVGTGTEDYVGGAWCFHANYTAPFLGYPLGDLDFKPGGRHGIYRFHIMDPIRFQQDLRVQVQALALVPHGNERRFRTLPDDISTVAYWYQTEPHQPHPTLPNRELLDVY